VRRGDPAAVLSQLARELGAQALYFNKDYTPAARARDARVTTALAQQGVRVAAFKDQVVFEEREILTGAGSPYTVFTPYKRAWLARPRPLPLPSPTIALQPVHAQSLPLPTLAELGIAANTQDLPRGGEAEAQHMLDEWIASKRAAAYADQRDLPAVEGTSRLSPHLRFGTISPRLCVAAAEDAARDAGDRSGFDVWISELIWREFYQQVLANFPHSARSAFQKKYDDVRWGSGDAELDYERFEAWCAGRTGFPIVDAAMRQLRATSWMHNRARMIVSSFFTKDLLLDWRRGERYFMQQLVDGDPASNVGGWQWSASTGTDAQPYFRVFNPRLQSERFDPDGAYIRRWVPELAHVRGKFVHAPHEMTPLEQRAAGCVIGEDYPAQIVDHATQKDEIVRRFKTA
jgi:deoxyribodipyrimidine photo-lyase